jgi:tetrapyrrole methylase family protein/MazG family protein
MTTGNLSSFDNLNDIIARLRRECPWDREQTHSSLCANLLEECYEALEALDEGDAAKLRLELGDLLMQVLLHARIAEDAGEFTLDDVIRGISAKLIHRHPHVFGGKKAQDREGILDQWDRLKSEERGGSLLDSVPPSLPALAYGQEIQLRAARQGFDWEGVEGVVEKLDEEVKEVLQASTPEERGRELGDLLFTLVNMGRKLGLDMEATLRQANRRFLNRFRYMEDLCRQRGLNFAALSMEEKEALWREAKAHSL